VVFVHFVIVEIGQETKGFGALGALVDSIAEVNFQMFHVIALLLVGARTMFTLKGFLGMKKIETFKLFIIKLNNSPH
jgi:hypothetical protein